MFFGVKLELQDIRIFSCICYALIHPQDHLHLEPRALRGIFVGVDEERMGYRVVLDGAKKFIVACLVTFYEHSLVDAMRMDVGRTISDLSKFITVPTATKIK